MAEHDYNIANQSASAARSDLNNAFAAIVSNNSKATAPSTTFAFMWWYDTTNNLLKMRNAADSDWVIVGYFNQISGFLELRSNKLQAASAAGTDVLDSTGTKILSLIEATQVEAQGGTNQYAMMTPRRVSDAINTLAGWTFVEELDITGDVSSVTLSDFVAGYSYRVIGQNLNSTSGTGRHLYFQFQKTSDSSWVGGTGSTSSNVLASGLDNTMYFSFDLLFPDPDVSANIHMGIINGSRTTGTVAGLDTTSSVTAQINQIAQIGFTSATTVKAAQLKFSSGATAFKSTGGSIRVYKQAMSHA